METDINLKLMKYVAFKSNGTVDLTVDSETDAEQVIKYAADDKVLIGKYNSVPNLVVTPVRREPREKATIDNYRGKWDSKFEFIFSCLSISVGLGNIWRFPVVVYENGGGAFFIPYLITVVFMGEPLCFLEMAVGQFTSSGCIRVWKVLPIFKGIGGVQTLVSWSIVTYHCGLMAIAFYYLIQSLQPVLPWTVCNPYWDGKDCHTSDLDLKNFRDYSCKKNLTSSAEQYFLKCVLHQVETLSAGISSPDWHLATCLVFPWFLIFLAQAKSVTASGKLSYFTALFPYCALAALFLRAITLEGAVEGILFFLRPQWNKLLHVKVWYEAVVQCFFSMGIGTGSMIMLSSLNRFNYDIHRDALIISLVDTVTSFVAGVTLFAILGNLASRSQKEISFMIASGPKLLFVTYPEAIGQFDVAPQVFAVVFFVMVLTLGIGAASSLTGALISTVIDSFSSLPRWLVSLLFCLVGFSIGLVYITPVGLMLVDIVDYFGGGCMIFIIAILQTIVFCWIYGIKNLSLDVEFMLGFKLGLYWKFTLGYFIPISLVCIFTAHYTFFGFEQFHPTLRVVGCGFIFCAMLPFPLMAMHAIYEQIGFNCMRRIENSFRPGVGWGPKDQQLYTDWLLFRQTGNRNREMNPMALKSNADRADLIDINYNAISINSPLRYATSQYSI